jgi:hypothetical protein
LGLFGIERTPPAAHLEEQYTKRPKVDMLAVALLIEQNLWGEISESARPEV